MISFVFMNKKTGDLLVAYRVAFMDVPGRQSTLSNTGHYTISMDVQVLKHDGWVVEYPVSQLPWFFNLKCEKWFINLGEL